MDAQNLLRYKNIKPIQTGSKLENDTNIKFTHSSRNPVHKVAVVIRPLICNYPTKPIVKSNYASQPRHHFDALICVSFMFRDQ